MTDKVLEFTEIIRAAQADGRRLSIHGGKSKQFYGNPSSGEDFDVSGHRGIVNYESTELIITARGGTPLAEIEAALAANNQMLAFEPPHFGATATLGGTIATGLSGPRRMALGAVRDFVLGVRLLDGQARDLQFGGQVMKNVAGYDVSRLLAGSLGTLGVILEVSLKVLPRPQEEATLAFDLPVAEAIKTMNEWAGTALPVSATVYHDGRLFVRLSSMQAGVAAAIKRLGGEQIANGDTLWTAVREHTHPFFVGNSPLWRVSNSTVAAMPAIEGPFLMEWNGGVRWYRSNQSAEQIRAAAAAVGGHATLFRGDDKSSGAFHPLNPTLLGIHGRLKENFDPAGILNVGKLYPDF